MAKSLRSKWKRKMRAAKREKNDKRVLAKLKETLQNGKVIMTEDMCKIKEREEMFKRKQEEKKELDVETTEDASMEEDTKRSQKTLLDQKGNPPVWLHRRQVRRLKEKKLLKSKKKTTMHKSRKLLW